LPILGENGDHVPAHYMMHVNGIISIVDSAPLFRLEELMTQNDESRMGVMSDYTAGARSAGT
jgi:hypothetical protein